MAGDILDGASVRLPSFRCCARSHYCGRDVVIVAASWDSVVEINDRAQDGKRADAGDWDEDLEFSGKTG